MRELAEWLRKDGVRVWFDEWVLKPGDSIPAKIDPALLRSYGGTGEGLEQSRVLACPAAPARRRMLCMSANAFGSEWAQLACPAIASLRRRKAGTFRFRDPLNQERRFIPLWLDDAPIKGSLAQLLFINWFQATREPSPSNAGHCLIEEQQ